MYILVPYRWSYFGKDLSSAWWEIEFFAFSRLLYLIKPKCIVYKNIKHVNDKQDQELYCKEHYQKAHEKDDFLVFRKAQQ